ncbi:hypothetical protein MG293_012458 [Ovis ammon polii]|uniref:VLIG-type G domain-containing protein n=1 Tax=Ovis ammon polii TaxID=230172 RepID=A0AAD4Y4Q2_OVIAM|nr:hypothetical protein MG293_012458 [Ovis ammon polii]
MQTVQNKYQELKNISNYRAQAFLVLTGLTATAGIMVPSPEEKIQRLALIKHLMGQSLTKEVIYVLTKHGDHDWENLEKDLRLLIDGNYEAAVSSLQVDEVRKQLQNVFHEKKELPEPQDNEKKKEEVIENGAFQDLLQHLGLEHYYPRKMSRANFQLIHKTSVYNTQPFSERELPFYFLQKLLMLDYGLRYLIIKHEEYTETKSIQTPQIKKRRLLIHMKIYLKKVQIRRSWQQVGKSLKDEKDNYTNQQMCRVSAPIVSFIRVGTGFSASKSQIMNCLLSERKHDVFFHQHCKGSSRDCLLMGGVVEVAWFCPGGEEQDRFDNCLTFTNLHGDAKEHEKQLAFLQEVSSIIVVLMSISDDNKGDQKIVHDKNQSSKHLIFLLDDKGKVTVDNFGPKSRNEIWNRNGAELIGELTTTSKHLLKLSNTALGLENYAQVARKQGMLIDEDQRDCKEAKEKTESLMTLLREMEIPQVKENLLPLQGKLWQLWCTKNKELYHLRDLMISGVPIELMDGDVSYVPLRWVAAVFDKLSEKLGNKRLFVLSVLGLQSSGKSTLLNALFGLQFTVSAGRCTRGAYMQLLKVEDTFTDELGFDFVFVVDTEGLRAPELSNKSQNHDNELATFVTGLGNLTLINILGGNPSEMQDIPQRVVQAFLRMKQVKISPTCLFVHQNVGEVTAKDQNMEGKRQLKLRLDKMAATAAEEEQCSDVTCFSDVIKFDANTHVYYFAHLWDGNPPMSPPNPRYSHNVQELKSRIPVTAQQESRGSIMKISEVKFRVQDL